MSIFIGNIEVESAAVGNLGVLSVYKGSELVFGGSVEPNLILNGAFDNTDNITFEPEWTINSGQAVYDGNGGSITFDLSETLSESTSYALTLEASNISTFVRFALNIEGASSVEVLPFTTYEVGSSGEIKIIFTVPTSNVDSNKLVLRASSLAGAYTIDNVNLSLASEATNVLNGTFDDNSFLSFIGDAWSVSAGKLNYDDSGNDDVIFYLDGYIANGETYNFNFTVDSGNIRVERLNEKSIFSNYTAGTYTISYTNTTGLPVNNIKLEFSNGAGASASVVDNVSLVRLGSELITNGDFSSGLTGWNNNPTLPVNVFQELSEELSFENTSGSTQVFTCDPFAVESGKNYFISLDTVKAGGNDDFDISLKPAPLGTTVETLTTTHTTGNFNYIFTATASQNLVLQFTVRDIMSGTVDNVSIREILN